MTVTFGSWTLKADLLNLKVPVPTNLSVQARIADLWSFLASRWRAAPRPFPGACTQRPCKRPISADGLALMTMSTSGTATPKAVPMAKPPLAKPVTSASGMMLRMAFFTSCAICKTTESLSLLGPMRPKSSATSASQPTALKVGAATGMALGRRISDVVRFSFSSRLGAKRPGGGPNGCSPPTRGRWCEGGPVGRSAAARLVTVAPPLARAGGP
mmetsp:Transcript_23953/g.65281  ORF Transcript_23953/g.65281 Transcript_23953/m.65281 type:complete len:214 (+) Transcript_23953:883-1524(+)